MRCSRVCALPSQPHSGCRVSSDTFTRDVAPERPSFPAHVVLRQGTYSNIGVHAGGNWVAASGDAKSIDTCGYASHCEYTLLYEMDKKRWWCGSEELVQVRGRLLEEL